MRSGTENRRAALDLLFTAEQAKAERHAEAEPLAVRRRHLIDEGFEPGDVHVDLPVEPGHRH